jgi:hypothetical protein
LANVFQRFVHSIIFVVVTSIEKDLAFSAFDRITDSVPKQSVGKVSVQIRKKIESTHHHHCHSNKQQKRLIESDNTKDTAAQ